MIKSKLRLFGWAVGLSLALGAVGTAVGVRSIKVATEASAALGDSITGGDCPNANAPDGWTATGTGSYSGNGVKFDGVGDNVLSPDIHSKGLKNITVKLKAGHNGGSGSTLTIAALDSAEKVLDSEDFVPTQAYNSQSTVYSFDLESSQTIYYVKVSMKTKTKNLGMKYLEVFDNTPAPVGKSFRITGVNSSDLYLKGETYDIGYEAVGFDKAPSITDVSWTVPSGAGSIADGKWTAGSSPMQNITLKVDLKADGDDYSAEVTTTIDGVVTFSKNQPKTNFTTSEVFTVGNSFNVTYTYAAAATIPENDPGISYRLESSGGAFIKEVVYGSTKFTETDSGKMIDATYNGVDLEQRYTITVLEVFDNSNGAYYLVTDESQLSEGDHVTFYGVYVNNTTTKTIVPSTFQANNLKAASVELDNGAIDGNQDFTILDFELKDTGATLGDSFAFMASNDATKLGQYLYAASTGSNHLKTQAEVNDDSMFVVHVGNNNAASIVAVNSGNRNVMSTNGSSMLVSCYASDGDIITQGKDTLYLYKWVSNADKVQEFIDGKMHLADYVEETVDDKPVYLNYCKDQAHNYYGLAKAEFNLLTKAQRELFWSDPTYSAAAQRLDAWRVAKGDSVNEDTKVLEANRGSISPLSSGHGNTPIIIAAFAGIGALAVGGMVFLRKRKEF